MILNQQVILEDTINHFLFLHLALIKNWKQIIFFYWEEMKSKTIVWLLLWGNRRSMEIAKSTNTSHQT